MNKQAKDKAENATARPWGMNLSGQVFGDNEQRPILYNNIGNLTNAEMNANAALIVRAVNSFDALVEACESALLEQVDDMGRKSETHVKLETALKLAKGNNMEKQWKENGFARHA